MTKLALLQPKVKRDWEPKFLSKVKGELSQPAAASVCQVVEKVADADYILFIDSICEKTTKDFDTYQELLRWAKNNGKYVFTLNFEDRPLGILPGIYTSLERRNFDPSLHMSWPHLESPNPFVEKAAIKKETEKETAFNRDPKQASFLFSFSGSCSHPLRRKLFSLYKPDSKTGLNSKSNWKVAEIKRWYDHTDDEHERYVEDILDSRFVLCPRGIASYSHRIFETMFLERIPVIIADDWVPFSFSGEDYYIQIPEKNLGDIAERLEQKIQNYDFYMQNLLRVKSRWFAPQTSYLNLVEYFLDFHRQYKTAHDPGRMLDRIKSHDFRKNNGLLSHQSLFAKANFIPRIGRKIFNKLLSVSE